MLLCLALARPTAAATLNFTVTASEAVTVTGAPRLAIDVGGVTRYATYASGSGTSSLTFSYAVQAGDFDANGIALASPVELNGGAIADLAGNPMSGFAFTLPDTTSLKIQTYTADFTTNPITEASANGVSFTIAKAPTGASFTYTMSSSGGTGTVTGSGTIASSNHAVSGIDVSGLAAGTLTLSVTLSTLAGGTGASRTTTSTPTLLGALDSLPAAAVLYSLRRLRGSYTGPLLRVRRSGDNTSADIGTTIGGDLDATALASFCGASSCFVSNWYDQSGNAQDATQAVTANQPRLVNAGATETEGGRPALRYTAAGQVLVAAPVPGQSTQVTIDAVARSTNATTNRHVLGDRNASGGRLIRAVSGGGSYLASNINVANVTMPGSTQQQRIVIMFAGGANLSGSLDGNVSSGAATSGFFPVSVSFGVGGSGGSTGDWIGTISEVAMFNSTLTTANRQSLERSQGTYFGITVP
jgi:hypothetical protein